MERCPVCGSDLIVVRDKPYQYTESGLNVVLIGITQYTCDDCKETFAAIPNPEQLHTTIALDICKNRKALLLANEIRFLRKELGLKSKELAMAMGVQPEQVSRWENGKASIGEGNDRMLRMIYRASVEKPCSDVSAKDRIISFLTSLPTKRKQIEEPHVIELNPQEWMRPQVSC